MLGILILIISCLLSFYLQTTGNLFVTARNIIHCFAFRFCYNESSKHKYIDFVETPFNVELDFVPDRLQVAENIVAAISSKFVNVFQIVGNGATVWTSSSNDASTSSFIPSGTEKTLKKSRFLFYFRKLSKTVEISAIFMNFFSDCR